MGEQKVSWFLITVVFVLDLIAFGLSVGAEQRRSKGSPTHDNAGEYEWCVYTSDIATGLSVGALLFILASQAVMAAVTRCLCCGAPLKPGGARAFAVIFFIMSWLCFVVAEVSLLAGAVENAKHTKYLHYFGTNDLNCPVIRKSVFAAGAAFTFLSFIFNVSYYLCYTKAHGSSWQNYSRGDAGVGLTPYS